MGGFPGFALTFSNSYATHQGADGGKKPGPTATAPFIRIDKEA